MTPDHHIGLLHLLATGGGGMLATIALVWRLWIQPSQQKAIEDARWKAQMESRMANGERTFQRHKETDDRILEKLVAIEERLRQIEIKMGAQ